MKIVIAGAGSVGCYLAKMLSSDYHELTIIDREEDRLNFVKENLDVVTVEGNPTSIAVLQSAGVDKVDLFIAVCPATEQDVNLVSALLAKQMGAKKVIARVNNGEYLSHENKLLFTELGIDLLFYPEMVAAGEILELLKKSDLSEFVDFGNGNLQILAFKLDIGADMIDKSPADYQEQYDVNNLQFRVLAIARGDETIIPTKDTIFRERDMVFIIAKKNAVEGILSVTGKKDYKIKRLTILGGGRIGSEVAKQFEAKAEFTKVIDKDRDRCETLSEKLSRTLVINGDGRNSDILYEEDVKSCDAFVAVTSNTETNIMACVAAKKMGVPKTIAEVENIEYIQLAEEMGVDSIINKKIITASRIYRFTMTNKVRTVKWLNGTDAEVLEYIVRPGSLITKSPIRDLKFPDGAIIGGIIRGNDSIIAVGDTEIKPYDRVAVFALPASLKRIDRFFE